MLRDLVFAFQAHEYVTICFHGHLAFNNSYMWRSATPIAADFATRDNVHVKVRGLLTCNDTVVLNQVKPIGVVCEHKCIGGSADSMNYGVCLFICEVEKSWGMTPKLKPKWDLHGWRDKN